ncbi:MULTISPECIES: NlpC/P60 family protein [unclassified Yoonia]|uniref:NlpC/P60 family protein n=1 Tax=unclassified Yoonia TaxID=2629118 RepID=UPI002B00076A|nr:MULTISPECIES: NlpC/P60 family protein [unclassified Yoonia]
MTCVVTAARGWIGTPYLHQGAAKGVGCDCLGLLRGLWRDIHGAEPEKVPAYTPDWSEPQGVELLWQAALRHMPPATGPMQPGDVLLFRMRAGSVAKHLGLVSATGDTPAFIHAYSGHGVVESPLSAPWARRIAARFIFAQRSL